MAPKAKPVAGTKRKSVPSGKSEGSGPTKKAKFGSARKNLMVKDDAESDSSDDDNDDGFGGLSDSEDGGAAVSAKKDGRKPAQNFDKGKQYNSNSSNGATSGQNSRESHAKQRQLAQERKAAKPLADELHRLKKLWEKLRRKSHLPKEERQGLVEELYGIITGRIKDFVLKHDAVRAVQTAVKYATASQRKQVARELQGTYAQLAESRYAKFLIGKLLVQSDDEIRDLIIPEFYGKVRKLINHPEASWILDDVYRGVATKSQKATLLREWYGPEFVLFKQDGASGAEPSADLPRILENEPSKRPTVLKYLFDMINALIQKKMTGFTMLHDAMLQYFLSLKPESEELKEFIEIIKEDENGDLLKNMAFTKSGARLVCLLLAHGNAKDRRAILKTYKDTFQLMCGDDHGHMVILAAYDVIDDTVATAKAIFPEVIGKEKEKTVENIIFLANNLNARTTICYLFEGPSKSLFPASHASDLALLEEVHRIRETTSKKNPDIRRQELIAAVSPPLLAALAASPNDLVQTSFGCQFMTDVLLSAVGDKTEALEAIASTAVGDPNEPVPEDMYPPPPPHISLTPHGGRMFKTLISGGRYDKAAGAVKPVDPPLKFADIIYPVIKDHVIAWATGPSSFTVLGLLEAADFSSADELKKVLRASANRKSLEKAAREETPEQRAKREAAAVAAEAADEKGIDAKAKSMAKAKGKAKGEKGKARGQQDNKDKQTPPVGNQGTKLLLARL